MATAQSTQNNDWFKSQQQYWDNWLETQRKIFGEQAQGFSAIILKDGFQDKLSFSYELRLCNLADCDVAKNNYFN